MRRTIALILVFFLLTALSGTACTAQDTETVCENRDYDSLLLRVYKANTGAAIREKYSSRKMDVCEGSNSHTIYLHDNRLIDVNPAYNGVRVKSNSWDYIVGEDGHFARYILFEAGSDPWQLLDPEILTEEVVGVELKGSNLVITTAKAEPFDPERYIRNCEKRTIITVDAKTLEILSLKKLALLPDGGQDVYCTVAIENNAECPFDRTRIQLMEHLSSSQRSERNRSVTFIIEPGMPSEYSISYSLVKGDDIVVGSYMINGVEYTVDEQRSTPSDKDRSNDAVYYLTAYSSYRRDCISDPTGFESPVIERIHYFLWWQMDFSDTHDDRYRINIGENKYLNDGRPLRTVDELTNAGEELYGLLADAGIKLFQLQKYKDMTVWLSKKDGYVLYDYNYGANTLGGDISVLVDTTNGKILGCWPGE